MGELTGLGELGELSELSELRGLREVGSVEKLAEKLYGNDKELGTEVTPDEVGICARARSNLSVPPGLQRFIFLAERPSVSYLS